MNTLTLPDSNMSVYCHCTNQYDSKVIKKPVTWTRYIQNTVHSSM